MEQIINYVKPELVTVAVALYFIGTWMKQLQEIKDKYIPFVLGAIGIAICVLYVFATCECDSAKDIMMAAFTAITQGILVAGASTYVNQLVKQSSKEE